MRKPAEAFDHLAVLAGVAELLPVAELGEQQQRAILIGKALAVLERHVEKAALVRLELLVEAVINRAFGDRQGKMIGGKLVGGAAEHVARELVEQDDPGERAQRIIEKALDR